MMNADIVITSNAVFTGLEDQPRSGAIAISGNRIIAVGTESEMASLIGPATRTYRFADQLVVPGFHDFHAHIFLGCLFQHSVNLISAESEEQAVEMVRSFADQRSDDPWIIGFGWSFSQWKEKRVPHRTSLDRSIPDRPVFLLSASGHDAWLNSKALEMLDIDCNTPDPPGGKITRDEHGKPTGYLCETAIALAQRVFDLPRLKRVEMLEGFLQQTAKYGITSVSDMFPITGYDLGDLEMYREFEWTGRLTTRIHFLARLEENLDHAIKLRNSYNSDKLRFSGLKNFLDGVMSTYTGYLLEPYSDRPETSGYPQIPPDVIKQWTVNADKEGFRVRLHACGDAAVRLGLDCFEAARHLNGPRDSRHTIEHIEVIHPDDICRFSQLGVIASMQPDHLALTPNFADNPFHARLGSERTRFTWPINTLKRHGARLAFGSDFPVVGLNPMMQIYRCLSRLHNDGQPEGGWNPQEKISLAEAIRAYTLGSAYGDFREHELGTLEPGKLADLVVLDRNLFDIPVEEIREVKVKLTVMDGKVVKEG
jgi:predicted amidohydrolase YtcJ